MEHASEALLLAQGPWFADMILPPVVPVNIPVAPDGDAYFNGFRSRPQPRTLPPGVARYIGNMRVEQQAAKVRAGNLALSADVVLAGAPLVLDFALVADIAITSITRASSTATVTTTAPHGQASGTLGNIRGAAQTEYNGDFIITVTGTNTFTYTVTGTPATPATGTIILNCGPIVAETYADTVAGSCVYADSSNTEGIIMATQLSAYAYREGESTATIAYPAGEEVDATDKVDLKQFVNRVYLFRGKYDSAIFTVSSMTRSTTTVTVNTGAAHGLATNDWITISGADQYQYNGLWQVTYVDADTVTFTIATTPASPATGTITTWKSKVPLYWDMDTANDFVAVPTGGQPSGTFSLMPSADWCESFNQRLVLPSDRDEIIYSDLLDPDSYDLTNSELRIMPGTKDWLVGIHAYQDFQFLVFYRKSIHLVVFYDAASLAGVKEVTHDIGCAARRTIVTCGNQILWLSDQGVHRMNIGDTLSLRGDTRPLSDTIGNLLLTINWGAIDKATAVYYNNRYYLAVPTNDATGCNTLFIYNFINSEWESVDTFPTDFWIQGLHVMEYAGTQRLHCTSTTGWVYVMEENDAGDQFGTDGAGTPLDNDVVGTLQSRGYTWGTLENKRMNRVQVAGDFEAGDSVTVTSRGYNPDSSASSIAFTATSSTGANLRGTSRARGDYCTIDITTSAGRPEISSIKGDAAISDRTITNQV